MAEVTTIVDPDGGAGYDYLSLNAWEAGEQTDLVTDGDYHICETTSSAGSADTTAVTIDGWTTGADNYILIEGEWDGGEWDTNSYRLEFSGVDGTIAINEDYVRFVQIQYKQTRTAHWQDGLSCSVTRGDFGGPNSQIIITNSYFWTVGNYAGNSFSFLQANLKFVNNLVVHDCDYSHTANTATRIGSETQDTYAAPVIYNNTIIVKNGYDGVRLFTNGSNTVLKNNIVHIDSAYGNAYFSSYDFDSRSDYNASSDTTTTDGTNDRASQTFSFNDASNGDYSLASDDTGALDHGTDLSSDTAYSFEDDITGTTRSGTWDIGAYAYVPGGADHELTADDLVTGSPVLSSPAISQIHGLSATGISTGSPVLGSPSLGGVVELAANDLVSNAPVSGTPAISQGHSISATGIITGSPVVGTPAPDQGHSLTANSVVSGAPIIPSPAIGQVHTLESGDLETCQPVLGSPTLSTEGSHSLEADGVVTGDPVSGTPEISQSHSIGAPVQITTGSPSVGTPAISQRSSLSANSVVSGAPVLSDPALSQNHSITPTILLSGAPDLGSPGLSTEGVHSLTAVGIIVTPDISETAITQNHGLVPTPVTAGAPAIGTPELTIGVTSVSLTATGIITGSPALEFPAITQTHDIAPVGFVTGVPDIGEAAFPGGTVQVRIWIRRS
jgi:hypothetical protein